MSSITADQSTSASTPNRWRRSSTGAGVARPRTPTLARDQMFGSEQRDAEARQLVRGDVEEVVGRGEVELDPGRLVLGGQIGEAGDVLGDSAGEVADEQLHAWEVAFVASQVEGDAGPVPDVVGGAPPAGVELVVHLERDFPRIAGVLGDRQPDTRREHGPTGEALAVAVEQPAHRIELTLELAGATADDGVGAGERREHGPQHLHVGRALTAEIGLPTDAVEE